MPEIHVLFILFLRSYKRMKILIVEDNDRLRKSLLDYLRDEGFATDAAADGEEGLYKAMNWDYDALILDVMMPVMDGFEVLKKLRGAGRTMPVLCATSICCVMWWPLWVRR